MANVISTLWKAIKPDGTLVEPGTAGTLKLDQASASAGIRVNTKVELSLIPTPVARAREHIRQPTGYSIG